MVHAPYCHRPGISRPPESIRGETMKQKFKKTSLTGKVQQKMTYDVQLPYSVLLLADSVMPAVGPRWLSVDKLLISGRLRLWWYA